MKFIKIPIRRCANCGIDLYNTIIETGQTFYCESTNKIYCSYNCMGKCKEKHQKLGGTYSEIIAKQYLIDLNLKPDKCNKTGYPDFKCHNKIWVEIKTPCTGLNKNQIKKFKELLIEGEQIFILYVDEKDISFFELKMWRNKYYH